MQQAGTWPRPESHSRSLCQRGGKPSVIQIGRMKPHKSRAEHQGATGGSPPPETDSAGARVYLIEADADSRACLQHLLAAEFTVEAFADVSGAVEAARQIHPHLLLVAA